MPWTRRAALSAMAASTLTPQFAFGLGKSSFDDLIWGAPRDFEAAMNEIKASNDQGLIAPLIQAMRFSRRPEALFDEQIARLAGTERRGWFDWMLWQEAHPEIIPHPDFAMFKRGLFLQIDENFADFLRPEYLQPSKAKIRIEEITWGGVIKDGIPSLDNPSMIKPEDADYLRGSDLVFGVSINGDTRAYPLRIMGWHEMFNDTIGGVPVALAYCTLCGSGILFDTTVMGRPKPLVFGSSGFLYRSNKLMFDRETHSLWNQYTGKPVLGPLVGSGIELQQRPVSITTWADWQKTHPDTRVLDLNTGYRRDYGSGVVYKDYFASKDLMFPVQVDQSQAAQKDYVYAIRQFGAAKAWPITAFRKKRVINDQIGNQNVVLVGKPKGRTVRAYERGDQFFTKKGDGLGDMNGASWQITEDALLGPDGKNLPRIAGHISYWFAWQNYMGAAGELYQD